jgi:hypothetical protein
MNHQYIDEHDIAGQYLRQELVGPDREAFQSHLVDCPECADRVLLAEMFQTSAADAMGRLPKQPALPDPRGTLPVGLISVAVVLVLAVMAALFWPQIQDFIQ